MNDSRTPARAGSAAAGAEEWGEAGVTAAAPRERRQIQVRGIVQGVGFRPFVYRLANELGLAGWVRNDGNGVTIEAEGSAAQLQALLRRLRDDAPPRARVDQVLPAPTLLPASGRPGFAIVETRGGPAATVHTAIGPDSAVCPDCLADMFDPANRRWRYAFTNCTNCGPRYTITRALPYDRAMTSMASFAMCPACAAEYASPLDRRFHAEPNACPACGPTLSLLDAAGAAVADIDPVAGALQRIGRGEIVAVKGLGGFHLVCDARNASAVATLRSRKGREAKPLAVMVANVASGAALAEIGAAEADLALSAERPIVLLRKSARTDALLPGVAPGLAWLGLMLPCTPLQMLLFHEAAGRPAGTDWLQPAQALALVTTSANPGGEPLVTGNDEALARLAGIADAFLLHGRDIVQRCDDSVLRAVAGGPSCGFQFIRRARGYTPQAIRLAQAGPPVLALGGWFKNTVCVTRGDEAFVSQHVGDLDNAPTCEALDEAVAHLLHILQVRPARVAHDLHPDFYSTRLAARLAAEHRAPLHAVQHHQAHIAAVLAEHRVRGPVLGLALDGVGLGADGSAWGGELLRVDGAAFTRLGRLRPLRLPGGDRAAREPWRMAAAALSLAGRGDTIAARFASEPAAASVATLLQRGLHAPETSSLGRWFDAAAGLLGISHRMAFEGQAAMLLEGLAEAHGPVAAEPALYGIDAGNQLDLTALALRLADESDAGRGAALFHATLVSALADWVARAAGAQQLRTVACGGGCFLNALLAGGLQRELAARGLTLLQSQAVPPNDGGLSLGQAWVALQAATAS
ncbi:MAG: carbamoyltransferase HypF [Betaproteobacteria bacterium]|nr:carbamoyltransferase HypF [Betaproteobacteria bacterium]